MNILQLLSPAKGTVIALSDVPDPVFSQKLLGDGVALTLDDDWVCAPSDGDITALFPTLHAIGLTTPEGLELLIHIGIDTVELQGNGFKSVIKAGDAVRAGQRLIKVNRKKIAKLGKSTLTPLIITNMDRVRSITPLLGAVLQGDVVLQVELHDN
jgi:glucose-specific phosphotransferase system IIA component